MPFEIDIFTNLPFLKMIIRSNQSYKEFIKYFFLYFFAHFLMLRNSGGFLVLNYEKVIFRSFNSGSIDVQTKIVLSVIWQIVASKGNLSKYCLNELV